MSSVPFTPEKMNQTQNFGSATVVVTGASSGIGQRTAELLLQAGAKVVALDRNAPKYQVTQYIPVDLSDAASIDAAVFRLKGESIQGLCNIAGVPGTVPDDVVARVNWLGSTTLGFAISQPRCFPKSVRVAPS
jgi:NAD(P)-dependent dehydrogenase (short-subunit alcohol dehydrogenase family)